MLVPPITYGMVLERSPYHQHRDAFGEARSSSRIMNTQSRINAAVREWESKCSDRKTIVFCVNREHAQNVVHAFKVTFILSNTRKNDFYRANC